MFESGYFLQKMLSRNVFHSYSHKCSAAFRCQRLAGIFGFNRSICEYFNAYYSVLMSRVGLRLKSTSLSTNSFLSRFME